MFFSSQAVDNLALLDIAAVKLALSGAMDDRIKELRDMLKQTRRTTRQTTPSTQTLTQLARKPISPIS